MIAVRNRDAKTVPGGSPPPIFLDRERLFREKASHEKIQIPCLRDQAPP
jgi:hypothetical protein